MDCEKRRFPERKHAKHWLKKWKKLKGYTGLKNVYLCPKCSFYHVTSNERNMPKPVKLYMESLNEKLTSK